MEKIKEFLAVNDGDGSGDGSGDGYGYGSGSGDGGGYSSGYGSGYGYGDGSGDGYGDGSGDGYGSGEGYGAGSDYGLKSLNSVVIHMIDGVETQITKVKKNIAKGYIVNDDLTKEPCYIVKANNRFAHGKTLKEAYQDLQKKLFDDLNKEERVDAFLDEFSLDKKYLAREFFDWHNKLTGSCRLGRLSFVKNREIDLDNDFYTVAEFVEITKNEYGGGAISLLEKKILSKSIE